MKAIVKTRREYGCVEILDCPEPVEVGDGDVLVDVKCCAICGSDVHTYEYVPSSAFIKVPLIMGHEFSGVVRKTGSKVKTLKPGDRVMGESNLYCGFCENCRVGNTNVCTNTNLLGLTVDGAMAEQVVIGEQYLHKFPEAVSFEDAAAAQPSAVSVHAIYDNCVILPRDTVVVFGPGVIGYSAAQLAKIKGAKYVFVAGLALDKEYRLTVAERLGLIPVNLSEEDLEELLEKYTGRSLADVVLECSGSAEALNAGVRIVKKKGYLTLIGIYGKPVELSITDLIRKEVQIRTSYTATWSSYEMTIKLIEDGLLKLKPLCKAYHYMDTLTAFSDAINKTVLKPVLQFYQ